MRNLSSEKLMNVLGVTSPLSINTAACLLVDGTIVAAAEEERFTGVKFAPRQTPRNAINYCLSVGNLSLDDVDAITLGYDPPFRAWGKSLWSNLTEGNLRRGIVESGAYVEYLLNMIRFKEYLRKQARRPRAVLRKVRFITHHQAHAASAARVSGFDRCMVLTLDGVGEGDAGLLGIFHDNRIEKLRSIPINQSLGWLYGLTTELCGFTSHSHEGKLMALAAYGTPNPEFLRGIAELRDDGYVLPYRWHVRLERRFGRRRGAEEPLTQRQKDLAATVQRFLEEAAQRLARWLHAQTGLRDLALAGGVALNCDMNARIQELPFVDQLFIQPAAHDAGTALGAACEYYARVTGNPCAPLTHVYLGPEVLDADIETLFHEAKLPLRKLRSLHEVAEYLRDGKIIAWCQGRLEFGPRALGNRSLLGHPSLPKMKERMNAEVKHRESWRPFAPALLAEHTSDYVERARASPFMLLAFQVRADKQALLAAAVHVDQTARLQTVDRKTNPRFAALLEEFRSLTGSPAVLNTSLNDREKPLCLGPREALQMFITTGIDVLVLNDYVLTKDDLRKS